MAESGDLIDFVKKHYTREAVDAQEMLKNGISEVNENAERILSKGISRMQEDLKTNVVAMMRKVDASIEANSSNINHTISDMNRIIDEFTREINKNIVEMKDRTSAAESAAKMASLMAAASIGSFVALLLFILIGG